MAREVSRLQDNIHDKDLIFLCPSLSIAGAVIFCKCSHYRQYLTELPSQPLGSRHRERKTGLGVISLKEQFMNYEQFKLIVMS